MEPQYLLVNDYSFDILKAHSEIRKYVPEIKTIEEIFYSEDMGNKVDPLYLILLLNNKHSILMKVSIEIASHWYINSKVVSYLGQDLTKEEIKYNLDTARLLG